MKMENEDEFPCPKCNSTWMGVVEEWSNMHEREVLLHCYDCDKKFIVYYKFVKMVELVEEEIVMKKLEEERVELIIPMENIRASQTLEARARDEKMIEELVERIDSVDLREFFESWKKQRKE